MVFVNGCPGSPYVYPKSNPCHLDTRNKELLTKTCAKFLSEYQYGYNNFKLNTTNRSNFGGDSIWNGSRDTYQHSFEETFSKKLFNEREFPFIFANYSSFLSHLFPSTTNDNDTQSNSTSNEILNFMSSVCTNLTMSGK